MSELTPTQQKMLTGSFYIDGRHNRDHLEAASELVERGLLRVREGGDDQYTSYHYEPVEQPDV